MKKILVLDDEERIREIYVRLLTSEGYQVMEAPSAVDAHEILKRENFDLMLLDIKMPNLNGSAMYDVIEQFHRNLKVIVASVYPLDVQKRMIPDAYDYYDKSQGINLLVRKINRALGNGSYEEDEI